jgi:opacity protein-like surface antigen
LGNTKIIGGMASLVYSFQTSGSVMPYVLAGLGYYNVKFDIPGFGSADESKVGFGGGAGLGFPMGSASLFVEARYMNIATSGSAWTFFPIIVGVSFGGK